jgi:cytochrome c biogenesis protein CcmG/thiol:disulfide interchange protein DsbE
MNLRRAARIGALAVLTAGLAVAGFELLGDGSASRTTAASADRATGNVVAAAGALAPSFTLPRLSGPGSLAPSDFAGHVLVVNFWASWCSACRSEAPLLASLRQAFAPRGVRFLGIDYVDGRAAGLRFVHTTGVRYPVIADSSGDVGARYGVVGLPDTFIIDATGHLRYQMAGRIERAPFETALESVLRHAKSG